MAHLVQLSNGTTTINLAGSDASAAYVLQDAGWAPAVAGRQRSVLGGRGAYADEEERFTINIYGATQAAVMQALRTLVELLDQVDLAENDGTSPPVLLTIQLDGGTSMTARLIAVEQPPALPVRFLDKLEVYTIQGLTLRMLRQGAYLGATQTATSAAQATSSIHDLVFATNHRLPSPCSLTISAAAKSAFRASRTVLLASDQAGNDGLRVYEAEALVNAPMASATDAAGTYPSGGAILRYTPADTNGNRTGSMQMSAGGLIDIYTVLRSSSATVSWFFRPWVTNVAGLTASMQGPWIRYDGADLLAPTVVYLGTIACRPDQAITVEIKPSSIAGGPVLDLDVIALLNTTYGQATAIELPGDWETNVAYTLQVQDRMLEAPAPRIALINSNDPTIVAPLPYQGPLPLLSGPCASAAASRLRVCWLAPLGAAWRWYDAGAAKAFQLTATKRPAYLAPQ